MLVVEGTGRQVAGAVGVDGAFVFVCKHCEAEDVGIDWSVVERLFAVMLIFWV